MATTQNYFPRKSESVPMIYTYEKITPIGPLIIKNIINNILVKIVAEMFGVFAEILYLCNIERQESPGLDNVSLNNLIS